MTYKLFIVIILFFFFNTTNAQVGIGNTDPKATLDIKASNVVSPSNTDGILIPRVDNFPAINPTANQDGMMLFATGNGTPSKGFYYWDNNAGPAAWISIEGVAIQKLDDLTDGKSDSDGTNDGSSVFLGRFAGNNDDSTDNRNVGVGYFALQANITGLYNTAIGYFSLDNSTGDYNTAIGNLSLNSLINGSNNTALGVLSGSSNAIGNGNIFLGYQSGYYETGSNKLYIENSSANSNSSLIYGEFDTNILRTNGELQIGNPTSTGYAFPTSDGIANQIMSTDGNGQISFITRAIGAEKIDDLSDGKSDSDGTNNGSSVFLGYFAGLSDDSTDNRNVGVGYFALASNTNGLYNAAYGYSSLDANTTGDYNTAIGNLSLSSITTGSDNTALGRSSGGTNITGSGNVFLGFTAGYNETGSNTLYIENTAADSDNALIYGEFISDILRINGELQIKNPTGTGYAFPTADGTSNQVLQTDGNGSLSWADSSTFGTDDQNITNAILSGSNLAISIENGTGATVDLSPLQDADWFETGGTPPNSINDNIYTNGKVGISTTTPDYKLSISGVTNLNEDIASGVALRVNGYEALWFNGSYFSWGFGGTANYFADNVGIGIAAPAYKLDVKASNTSDYIAQIYNNNTGLSADGLKIRLGTSTPTTNNYFVGFYGNNTLKGRISGNTLLTGVNYYTTSDGRLKMNIISINNALSLINKIQPRKYEYKTNPGKEEYGFIAQELLPLYSQAVSGSPSSDVATDPMMVDYSRLTPLLTAGIKELHIKLVIQKKDIEDLQKENDYLKQKLNKLEQLEARLSALEQKK